MADPNIDDLGQLLTRLWQATRDRMIVAGQDPMTIKDVAKAVGATRAAVYLWFRNQRQPRAAALDKLANLFAVDDGHRREIQAQFLATLEAQGRQHENAPPPAFLVSSGIAERLEFAAHLWILKWQKRFRSGSDAFLFAELSKIFESGDYENAPRYHYVFPSEAVADEVASLKSKRDYDLDKKRQDLVAQRSFRYLEDQLAMRFPRLEDEHEREKVIEKHEITSLADVLYLGIPRTDALAFFMIEYKANGYERYGRWVDVFVEVDAKSEEKPDRSLDSRVSRPAADNPLTYWVALPAELSEHMRDNWKALFDSPRVEERKAA